MTCSQLIQLSALSENDIEIVKEPSRMRPIDADLQIPDTKKFREHTGWAPKFTFDQTMADLLSYWRYRVTLENPVNR